MIDPANVSDLAEMYLIAAACDGLADGAQALAGPATIETAFGKRAVVRRFGPSYIYAETTPTPSAPHGEFWVFNAQRGWVPVPRHGRALRAALLA